MPVRSASSRFRSDAPDRYGEQVSTPAAAPGRVSGFVRWVARTPWPVFSLGMLQADIIGALLVLGFLRFGLPPADRIMLQDLPTLNLTIFLSYLFVSFGIGAFISLKLLVPVFRWQRRDALLSDDDPAATEAARLRALRMPTYRSMISMTNWVLGAVVFIAASEQRRLNAVLRALSHQPVLTVSDIDGFVEAGGGIGLVTEDDRIRFDINRATLARDQLTLSAQLLKLARRLVGDVER